LRTSARNIVAAIVVTSFLATSAYGLGILTMEWGANVTAETGLYESVLGGLNYEDLNGDGVVDILHCRRKGLEEMQDRIVCLSGNDGSLQWIYPPPEEDDLPGDPMCIPAIGDLDGDGSLEAVAIGRNAWVHCIDGEGQMKWKFTPDAGSDNSACLIDLDEDGKKEVIFATGGSGYIYCLNFDGTERWRFEMGDGTNSGPTAWDLDRDGDVEIIVPCENAKTIYCIGPTGVEEWRFETVEQPGQTIPAIGDIDRDGEYEILVMVPDELRLYCLTFFGTEKWTFDLDPTAALTGYVGEKVSIGDIDGDGLLEAFVSDLGLSGEGVPTPHLYCVNADGTLRWTANAIGFTTLIGDFTGDGNMNIVGGRGFTQLMVLDNQGEIEYLWDHLEYDPNIPVDEGFGAQLWGPSDVTQIMGDLDNDGKIEWVLESDPDSMVYCFTADGDYDPEKMIWTRGAKNAEGIAVIPIPEGALLSLLVTALLIPIRRRA